MPKKIIRLAYREEYDFLLAGIICSFKDYRLCFEINDKCRLKLKREKDLTVSAKKLGAINSFAFFSDIKKTGEEFYLIANKHRGAMLIPEKPAMDFFLLVRNAPFDFDFNEMLKKIKQIEIVSAVAETDPAKLKSAHNLILD